MSGIAPSDESSGLEALASELAGVVGREHVVTDPSVAAPFGHDLTGRFAAGRSSSSVRRTRPRRRPRYARTRKLGLAREV